MRRSKAWEVYTSGFGHVVIKSSAVPTGAAIASGVAAVVTALGTPLQAGGNVAVTSSARPASAATASGVASIVTSLGTPAKASGEIDPVIQAAATDRGAFLTSSSAATLMAANASRRGF